MREERFFFRRLRGPYVEKMTERKRERERERKNERGIKKQKGAGERGAYADDSESGVQRAHSLTLLCRPGKIKVALALRPGDPQPSLLFLMSL